MQNNSNKISNLAKSDSRFSMDNLRKQFGKINLQSSVTIKDILKYLLFFIILVAIVYLIYWFFTYLRTPSASEPFFITKPVNANDSELASKSWKLPGSSDGLSYTYSFWMYVADWDYSFGKWKNIFTVGNNDNRMPAMWLYPKTNALHSRISTYADPNEGCDIQNIPLQKWVYVTYVLNNRTVDTYIDGKLERSCVLQGVPLFNRNARLRIAQDGGFFGQLAQFRYFNRALTPSEIYEIYSNGPYAYNNYAIQIHDNNGNNGNNGGNCN